MNTIFLSLGSNQGDRTAYLNDAVQAIANLPETHLIAVSSYYETAAWGKEDQADFLNIACQVETTMSAHAFLSKTQAIEQALGRVRHEKWGPRTIDIDLLLFNHERITSDDLLIPHPYMTQRAFVLIPLLEIAPNLRLEPDGKLLSHYLTALDLSGVRKVN
ncbi:2-amino-4-hydroxy-6-hydroxymethyldihydropteridine diphosphokinase [Streptococcus halichoeri]|uniref:2-amino-4-hydroxy-6- hydroxymethyldihydropteridine diphosphokinase n=1 Tax=Streptococcus halichoeri TaxID=254785 RepID=UPI001C8D6C47|nr:2-amino-4-hydroxy-6-hydroxymethyldihydropteridine diphosphokinase [Streptococcus halichoeri]